MASAGGSLEAGDVSVRTSIVPPGPCPPPADTPDTSPAAMKQQLTASFHDFAVSLPGTPSLMLPSTTPPRLTCSTHCRKQDARTRSLPFSHEVILRVLSSTTLRQWFGS